MTFQFLSMFVACVATLLGLGFLFAGQFMLKQWGLIAIDSSLVMSRRIGAVYLGLALLFFFGRFAAPSELRTAVCIGLGAAIGLLACLGLYELKNRRVSIGILVSVIVEMLLSLSFFWVIWEQQ